MQRFSAFGARFAGALLAVSVTAVGTMSHAQPSEASRGAASFERAHAAWARGDFDTAETLFKEALDQGGLTKKNTLDAHVYLGSARAVIGRREQALAAFRLACLIQPQFTVPAEAGRKAAQLADQVKRQKMAEMSLKVEAPSDVPAYQPFRVNVQLDTAKTAVLSHVELTLSDGLTVRGFKMDQPIRSQVTFEIPPKVVLADANLVVKVAGLDATDNEFVTAETRVHVGPDHAPGGGAVAASTTRATSTDRGASTSSFWTTPWPYILGGIALAGAGAGAYFLFRPSDQVTVTQVQVQAVR